MNIRGWVYVITNPAMPGLVKIGFSTKDPLLRASELANTGAPHPYEVEYDALVDSPRELEGRLHRALLLHREGREWFRLSVHTAVEALRKNAAHIYSERALRTEVLMPIAPCRDAPSEELEAVGEFCCYTPDCRYVPTRKYHHMAFCEEHYRTYMLGRAASRRRVGPGKGSTSV